MRVFVYLIVPPLLAASLTAAADIYRCTGAAGEPSFSERPCGADVGTVVPPRTAPAGSGLRPGERIMLRSGERRPRRTASARPARQAASAGADRRAYRCLRKRRDLDAVRARLRRGYRPAEGERLRRRRQAYEDYLDQFCS